MEESGPSPSNQQGMKFALIGAGAVIAGLLGVLVVLAMPRGSDDTSPASPEAAAPPASPTGGPDDGEGETSVAADDVSPEATGTGGAGSNSGESSGSGGQGQASSSGNQGTAFTPTPTPPPPAATATTETNSPTTQPQQSASSTPTGQPQQSLVTATQPAATATQAAATPTRTPTKPAPTASRTPTNTPPTATKTPTYTPTAPPPTATYTATVPVPTAPPDTTFNEPLDIPLDSTAAVTDFVSHGDGDTTDRSRYSVTGMNPNTALSGGRARLTISVSCFGTGTQHIQFLTGGQTYSCGQTIVDREVTADSDTGTVTITAIGGANTYVQWILTGTAVRVN